MAYEHETLTHFCDICEETVWCSSAPSSGELMFWNNNGKKVINLEVCEACRTRFENKLETGVLERTRKAISDE